MNNLTFRTPYNFTLGMAPTDCYSTDPESMTIPDQSLTVAQILQRHTRGLAVPGKQPIYNDDEFPDLKSMDLVDIQELSIATQNEIAEKKKLLSQAESLKRKKQLEQLEAEKKRQRKLDKALLRQKDTDDDDDQE